MKHGSDAASVDRSRVYLGVVGLTGFLRRRRIHREAAANAIVMSRVGGGWGAGDVVIGRSPNKHRHKRVPFWTERVDELSEDDFKRRYKVSKKTFAIMVEKLRPHLEPNHTRARASSGSPVTTELQLSMTLRWLAGARRTLFLQYNAHKQTAPFVSTHP